MELNTYVFGGMLGAIGFLAGKVWRQHQDKKRLNEELRFTKDAIAALFNKPVYVALSEKHIEQIGHIVGAYLKADKWVN